MGFLEWVAPGVGLVFIIIGLLIGLLYALKNGDNKNNDIENSYNSDIDDGEYDDDIY